MLAYTLIGGAFAGMILTLVFLPAMYSIWFKIKQPDNLTINGSKRPMSPQIYITVSRGHALACERHDKQSLLQW